jgi:hypothetical protein
LAPVIELVVRGDSWLQCVAQLQAEIADQALYYRMIFQGRRLLDTTIVELSIQPGQTKAAQVQMEQIGKLLEGVGATRMTNGDGEADVGPLIREGVPGLGLRTVAMHYFEWHHTTSDTLDKVDSQSFQLCIASLAVTSYILANMPGRLGE